MEKVIHKSSDRGFADHGWLKARHSFSFANYHNNEKMHFGYCGYLMMTLLLLPTDSIFIRIRIWKSLQFHLPVR